MSSSTPSEEIFDGDPLAARPSLILEVCSRAMFHAAIVFGIWLLAAGHNRPGGGFVGGLTIAAALILTYANGGSRGLERALPVRPLTLIGIGMLFAQATAFVPLLLGHGVLQSAAFSGTFPLFGEVKLTTPLFFDIGVMLVVAGLIAKTLEVLGGSDPADVGDGPARAPGSARPSTVAAAASSSSHPGAASDGARTPKDLR